LISSKPAGIVPFGTVTDVIGLSPAPRAPLSSPDPCGDDGDGSFTGTEYLM
jgi:hypothetical protein